MKRLGVVALVAMALFTGAGTVDTALLQEAKNNLDGAKYTECLQVLAKLLAHTSALEQTKERGMLLTLKGECLLRQKQGPMAQEAFEGAVAAYPAKDAKEAALAEATGLLIRKSDKLMYVPKSGEDRTGISIVEPLTRKDAFAALFRDEKDEDEKTMKPLLHVNASLASIEAFAPRLKELSSVEISATGDDKEASAMQKELAEATKKSIAGLIVRMNKQADEIAEDAVKMVEVGSGKNRKQKAKGLSEGDRSNLNAMLTNVAKITQASKTLTVSLATAGDFYKQEVEDARTLKAKVDGLFKTYRK